MGIIDLINNLQGVLMKFIEVVPQYPLPVQIKKSQDYFSWPVKMMKQKGYQTEIVCLQQQNQKPEEIIEDIKVKRFKNSLLALLYIYQQKNSLIYAQGKIWPALAGLTTQGRSVYTPHVSFGKAWPKYLRNPLFRQITKFLWSRFTKVIAITPYEKEVYQKLGFKPNYLHIYNGIDKQFFNQKRVINKEPVILFVGNLHSGVKNIKVLYQAFKIAAKKIKNLKLMIIGKALDIEGQKFLVKLKRDKNVIVTDWLKAEKVIEALSQASVFINTSKNEGHSLAVAEAAAMGVPLCLSNIKSFTSVYKTGALYHESEDYQQLAENIIKYLNNKKLADKNSQAVRKVAEQFKLKKIQNKYFKVLTGNET